MEGCEEAWYHRYCRDRRAGAVSKVVNEVGEVKERNEAVGVWTRHFEKVMNSVGVAEEYRKSENADTVGQFKLLDEDISREVVLALGELKSRVAAGRDGLTAEMVSCDILVDFWAEQFALSMSEVRQMLRDVAWREAVDSWREEARSHSKLAEID